MEETGIFSPWVLFAKKAEALFRYDDEVAVEYDEDEIALTLLVDNQAKADAIAKLMPEEVTFGNVTLRVGVVPCNEELTSEQVFRTAFDCNPVFAGTAVDETHGLSYVMYEPVVAQFKSDDISSAFGVTTMTYEQLAKDVLAIPEGTFVCSDLVEECE